MQPAMRSAFRLIDLDHPDAAGEAFEVVDEVVLGREGAFGGRLVGDDLVSRRHARVYYDGHGRLTLEDLRSTNGTFLNDVRVADAVTLSDGDVFRVGNARFGVQGPPVPEPIGVDTSRLEKLEGIALPVEQAGSPSAVIPIRDLMAQALTDAALIHSEHAFPVGVAGVLIGRSPENDIVLESDLVSRHHAVVRCTQGRWFLADLGSANGSLLNGERLRSESRWLNPGDAISIGGEQIRFLADRPNSGSPARSALRTVRVGSRDILTIGRDPTNSVCLDSPNVSRFHAEVVAEPGGKVTLRDLGSQNGTRLDGRPVSEGVVALGSEIGIGPFRLVFDGESFVERDDRGSVRLEARAVSVTVGDRVILDRGSLSIQPGEFIALIGESGAGKSTLIKVLAGVRQPTSGAVEVNGDPIWARLTDVGYLPQDEIVHPRLTVTESLTFSARLRLPPDANDEDCRGAVDRAVSDVSLQDHLGTRIGSLSGGQRKRVGLATELLSRPGLLFLDEPTTGLDPGLESRMMELFRSLAAVGKTAVLVATHATKSLDLVDKLCVVGRGGHLCFVGAPKDALSFFGVESYDEIYGALDLRPASEWRGVFERTLPPTPQAPVGHERPSQRVGDTRELVRRQVRVLLDRYLLVFKRDTRNLMILLLQAPLLAIAMSLLFRPTVFDPPGVGLPSNAAQLLFVIVTTVIWLGTIDAAREVIKERAIYARERAVGVDPRAYLASKLILLVGLAAAQTLSLLLIVSVLRPLHVSGFAWLLLLLLLVATATAAVTMGLAISALVRSEDQATAFIPIAMVIQLLFGGAIVTVMNMGGAMSAFSSLIFERWAYAGAGSVVHMNARIAADPVMSANNSYGTSFFGVSPLLAVLVLLVFAGAFGWMTLRLLRRPERS